MSEFEAEAEELCSNCDSPVDTECECTTCERCSDTVSDYDTQAVRLGWRTNEIWCDDCASMYATMCDGCNDYHSGDSYTQTCNDCSSELCESCSESGYYCESCDSWSCCSSDCCYSPFVGGYHEGNPEGLRFHGDGKWHLGIELELSADRYDAERILSGLGGHENVHFEEDGSVHDGWEMIFQPRTMASWQEYAKSEAFRTLSRMAQGGEHGFHVHVSRSAFRSGNAVRRFADILTGRANPEARGLLEAVAGRTENGWCQFEALPRKAVATQALKKDRWGNPGGYIPQRYRGAVNLNTGKPTFEIRLGCGTTNPVSVLAWLEMISAAVAWANEMTLAHEALGGLDPLALVDYMAGKAEYQHGYGAALAYLADPNGAAPRRRRY